MRCKTASLPKSPVLPCPPGDGGGRAGELTEHREAHLAAGMKEALEANAERRDVGKVREVEP